MVSLPFSDYCEPLIDSPEELAFLVSYLQAEMEHQEWKYLEVRPANGGFNPNGKGVGFHASKLCYLHRLGLQPNVEDIFRSLHKNSVQRRIRRAEKAGLVIECGRSDKLLRDFYSLLLLTRSRHHLPPQPYLWFSNLIESMGDSLTIRVAYKDQVPIAAVVSLRFRDVAYYKYGCSSVKFKNLGAMALLLWRTIRDSKTDGAVEFDLGRSEVENKGLTAFKDRWTQERTEIVYWRYPATDPLALTEGWKLKVVKHFFACVPHRFLELTGKLVYRHIG
jgi:lipid II:glycine glycyltransferase (peptidoglycan interpeptide bridge formation enzyme)